MKLIVAIVQLDDASPAATALIDAGFSATIIDARGGFLREGVAALLIGLDDHLLPRALTVLGRHCQRRSGVLPEDWHSGPEELTIPEVTAVEIGGASAYVLPVVRFERF